MIFLIFNLTFWDKVLGPKYRENEGFFKMVLAQGQKHIKTL